MQRCRMDGGQESIAGYEQATRAKATDVSFLDLPKKLPPDTLYEAFASNAKDAKVTEGKPIRGQVLTAFPTYRRLNVLHRDSDNAQHLELNAETWRSKHSLDSWHVQTRAMLHTCGASCFKYNRGGSKICRRH